MVGARRGRPLRPGPCRSALGPLVHRGDRGRRDGGQPAPAPRAAGRAHPHPGGMRGAPGRRVAAPAVRGAGSRPGHPSRGGVAGDGGVSGRPPGQCAGGGLGRRPRAHRRPRAGPHHRLLVGQLGAGGDDLRAHPLHLALGPAPATGTPGGGGRAALPLPARDQRQRLPASRAQPARPAQRFCRLPAPGLGGGALRPRGHRPGRGGALAALPLALLHRAAEIPSPGSCSSARGSTPSRSSPRWPSRR